VAPPAASAAVAVAIDRPVISSTRIHTRLATLAVLALGCAQAGVLPDDRADILWHRYNGGGITIQGPSILVRKKFGDHFSVAYNHYEDMISGASIDVITQASPYKEHRKQDSLSVDILHGKTTYSAGYIGSKENDYKATTAFASVSQDMFGDLTTISFGFTRGWDKVGELGTPRNDAVERRNWQVGLSQILTRNMLLGLNFETSESEGFLNNPYRQVRYIDISARGYDYEKEKYPHTRTGNAASGQLKYFLPWHAALSGSYRFFSDTWGIKANTAELGYTQPLFHSWTLDTHVRLYSQNQANFYSDLFSQSNAQNFEARDRELASFKNLTMGVGATWEYHVSRFSWLQKGTINLRWDRMHINYEDFRDLRVQGIAPGTEPLYTLDANILQGFISFWF
jgi:Protein of unknown function (DUF3570)